MRYNLFQHKADTVQLGLEIRAGLEPKQSKLILSYEVKGRLNKLILPNSTNPIKRLDNLWQNTCFEAFFKFKGLTKYIELNLSPFAAYNAYLFDNYRLGMREYELTTPRFYIEEKKESYFFMAEIADFKIEQFSELSLATILRLKSGETSHWATKHASQKPDFHLQDSFIRL